MPLLNDGIIIVDKEAGYTSRDVVNKVSKILNIKKVGHTGTLDPIATGVLVLTIGRYTKLTDYLTSINKEYVATMKLGILTDTLDITGNILKETKRKISSKKIIEVFNNFPHSYEQTVPIFSSVHVNGKRLYEYARAKKDVILPKRKVIIEELELLDIKDNMIKFRCVVSKGTYIRSLINDLANMMGTFGTMISLNRTRQGIFSLEYAAKLNEIQNNKYNYITLKDIFNEKIIEVDDEMLKAIKNGQKITESFDSNYVLFTYKEKEIALYKKDNNIYRVYVMLDID